MDSYNFRNLSDIFLINNVFPETTTKLLSILNKKQGNEYEEVKVKICLGKCKYNECVVLRDGYFPELILKIKENHGYSVYDYYKLDGKLCKYSIEITNY